jgi:penicillin-binding protein 1A
MDDMLKDVVNGGTGRGVKMPERPDMAGKTGISNDYRDAWFAGYSSGIVTVVWAGYDQPKSMGTGTGASLALPIWARHMPVALDQRPQSPGRAARAGHGRRWSGVCGIPGRHRRGRWQRLHSA